MFVFLFAPIGLPGIGASKAISGVSGIIGVLVKHLDYFLTFLVIFLLIGLVTKVYKNWYKNRLKKINILLYKLYSEILLSNKYEKETIDLILIGTKKWFFVYKVGKIGTQEIVDALNSIKSGKLNVDIALLLVTNWINMLNHLIANL
ncbi:MAG: hypothetical protein SZ59_C0001G0026 [candidate division TM6 bacterium GW2011_GWF2_28_16]|nr:MAG: hypothetical protein SZ59_C0001G0026 [candidate division TM6 bacterium GW2011_GWF2_28_16]